MSKHVHRETSSGNRSSTGPRERFIRSAVLGLAFGSVLFVVSDQTALAEPLLRWLNLPGVGNHLGPKQLVIVGVLLGVALDALDQLFPRARRFLGDLVA